MAVYALNKNLVIDIFHSESFSLTGVTLLLRMAFCLFAIVTHPANQKYRKCELMEYIGCSWSRSPNRLPVSPMYNFLQRVQVMQ